MNERRERNIKYTLIVVVQLWNALNDYYIDHCSNLTRTNAPAAASYGYHPSGLPIGSCVK